MNEERRPTATRFAGGVSRRVDNLLRILDYVGRETPSRAELLKWTLASDIGIGTEGTFDKQVGFIETLGFLDEQNGSYTLGPYGRELLGTVHTGHDGSDVVYAALTNTVSGFEYLLDRLSRNPIQEDVMAEVLGEAYWNYEPAQNVAEKHYKWLRAIDYVERVDGTYRITPRGRSALAQSAPREPDNGPNTAGNVYEAVSTEVRVRQAFRDHVFEQYDRTCLLTEIDRPEMLTLAHVLPRSEHRGYAEDPGNVFVANWNHHRAFDAGLFTFDSDHRVRVSPDFETGDSWLRRTILERDGERIDLPPDADLDRSHLKKRNQKFDWLT